MNKQIRVCPFSTDSALFSPDFISKDITIKSDYATVKYIITVGIYCYQLTVT